MKKVVCAIGLLALLVSVVPVCAQNVFVDVPPTHWAYDAVQELVNAGVIVGYPDGTFGGKRAMTRFEFAQALARAIPYIVEQAKVAPAAAGVSQEQFNQLQQRVNALEQRPAGTPEVTKADLENLRKLVNEFRDELTAMGVDIDALKRDVKELDNRLTRVEAELDRVKVNGVVNVFAIGEDVDSGVPVDRDERTFHPDTDLLENLAFVKEIDLQVTGKVSDKVKAYADINAGDYLSYLSQVDDYAGGFRPTSKVDSADAFFPWLAYFDAPFGNGSVTAGRLPMSWTPYTLRMIDVDSYTTNIKTDTGEYPIDGIKAVYNIGGVALQGFAGKMDMNDRLLHGLTSQSTAGLYNNSATATFAGGAPFHAAGGHGMAGLNSITNVAGARAVIGTPFKGNLGLSYINAASSDTVGYDSGDLMGADLNLNLGNFTVGANWARTDTFGVGAVADIDGDNTALDANLGFGIGRLGITGGWKSIERNFAAPGFWDKLGRWTNPTNVEGPYAALDYGITAGVKLTAKAEFLSGTDDFVGVLPAVIDSSDDDVNYYLVGLNWGLGASTGLDLGLEWVQWKPAGVGADTTDEQYITIGLGHQFNPNMMAKISYQIVDYDASGTVIPYGADYEGNLAVAQFMVKF